MDPGTPEEFFAGNPTGLAAYARVLSALDDFPDLSIRVSKSQIAFRRARGLAFMWVPSQYLRGPTAPVVLSIASHERIDSPRFKEVVHPGPWVHHLEVSRPQDVDGEVVGWLDQAARDAGRPKG